MTQNPPTVKDPRLEVIQLKRATQQANINVGNLLLENAMLRLKELDLEEARIIAEGKANEKTPPATPPKP